MFLVCECDKKHGQGVYLFLHLSVFLSIQCMCVCVCEVIVIYMRNSGSRLYIFMSVVLPYQLAWLQKQTIRPPPLWLLLLTAAERLVVSLKKSGVRLPSALHTNMWQRTAAIDCVIMTASGVTTSSPRGGWSIVISMTVCLYVCLYSVGSHVSKTTRPNLTIFSVRVICGRVSVLCWQHNTLRTSGFVNDVMFSYNSGNRPDQRRCLCFVQFARWRHRGRSLPSPTTSYYWSAQWASIVLLTGVCRGL